MDQKPPQQNTQTWPVLIIGCILAGTIIAIGAYRLSGSEAAQNPPSTIVELRALKFEDRADGSVAVYDAGANEPFEVLPSQSNGFLRGTLRTLVRARKLAGVSSEPPFEVIRWADGRLSLRDPAVGSDINLVAFGQDNYPVFKRFLTEKGVVR
jgi:putative photosynthetic complex assembly protein